MEGKLTRIARGPYAGSFLMLPDAIADAAVTDKWGQDASEMSITPEFPPIEDPPTEDPQSMIDYFADPFATPAPEQDEPPFEDDRSQRPA